MQPTRRWTASLLLLAACTSTEPTSPLPAGPVPLAASASFAGWWEATEACSGRTGRLDAIEWFTVPGAETFDAGGGRQVVGEWIRSGDRARIIIAGNYAGHEMVIRHEMLHQLLGKSGHPVDYFENRCGLTWAAWEG